MSHSARLPENDDLTIDTELKFYWLHDACYTGNVVPKDDQNVCKKPNNYHPFDFYKSVDPSHHKMRARYLDTITDITEQEWREWSRDFKKKGGPMPDSSDQEPDEESSYGSWIGGWMGYLTNSGNVEDQKLAQEVQWIMMGMMPIDGTKPNVVSSY